ncbi:MAG TPA: acyl-CoA dehydrogenase family protein [Thermomicrobiaceae bacterium]|nr:acyl-CoA dehydrogenase family protein [Thermomicrobiaceae bacterium]
MDFTLSSTDRDLVERARGLAAEFAPRAREYDEAAAFPEEDFARLREEGFLTLTVPVNLGGHGMWQGDRYLPFYTVLETIAAGSASTAQLLQIQSHATGIVAYLGNDEQRRRILGDVVRRGALMASCGSEADPRQVSSGRVESGLRPAPGGFRLTGVKHFGSLAPAADYYLVYVMAPGTTTMAEGYTTVVVPKDSPGVSFDNNWDTMGMRATISWSLKLDDVFVPWENVIGQPGDWIQHDPRTFTLAYVANHLGTAQGAFDFVSGYLRERPYLMNDDTIAFTLGEMDAALQATRTSMWYAAWLWEQGRFAEAEMASMRALHSAKQTALMVTTKAFDVCGARAAFKHLPLDRALRDARTFSLHFRESQVMRMLAEADLGGTFHSKQKYGPKLGRGSWAALGLEPAAEPAH